MALIQCKECGNEISDKAQTCPRCGCPIIEEPKFAEFILKREKATFFCAVRYEVYIDGQNVGIIKNGETIKEVLPCGSHHLEILDKNNFNRNVYGNNFYLGTSGITMSFSAAMNITMREFQNAPSNNINEQPGTIHKSFAADHYNSQTSRANFGSGMRCPRCGGLMTIQTVSEARNAGCATVLFYILLAVTILGLLVLIPILLRKKTKTVSYHVCQRCGYKKRV